MKRSLHRILSLCLFLVMLVISLFPLSAGAEDYSTELQSLDYNITLMEDGSAFIIETREIVFSGDHEFSRYRVNNVFAGPRVFTGWEVSIDGIPVTQLDEPDNEYRPENTFAVEESDGGNTVNIYFRQQGDGTRVIQICYWVENAVKLYDDVGEFFWNLTGETGISDIGTLTATLSVPYGVPDEEFRIWAHGPLNGTFEKQSDGYAALYAENVPLGTIVDIRTTMPANCFYGGWEQEGEALPDILTEEQELADRANAKREEEKHQQAEREAELAERHAWEAKHPILAPIVNWCSNICDSVGAYLEKNGWNLFGFSAMFLFVGIFIIVGSSQGGKLSKVVRRFRLRERNSPAQSPQYYRDLPDDRPAPAVDKLVHFYDGKTDISRQISATLLELDLKKLVKFQMLAEGAVIILNEQQSAEQLPDYQKTLLEFLWSAAGDSRQLSMTELKAYIRDYQSEAREFRHSFESEVRKAFAERATSRDVTKYAAKRGKRRLIISAIAGGIAMLIRMVSTLYNGIEFGASLKVGLAVFAVVLVLQLVFRLVQSAFEDPSYVLDQQGEDDRALWEAFGRFLDDFTTFADKDLPEFSVWREYMVYAVAMGKGQKVAKALAARYPEAVSEGMDAFNDDIYWMQDADLYDAIDSIGRDVAAVPEPRSSGGWSDGDGGGGGFSDSGGGSDSGSGGDSID